MPMHVIATAGHVDHGKSTLNSPAWDRTAGPKSNVETTRRVAMPLLELLDRMRRTVRVDSQRRSLRPG